MIEMTPKDRVIAFLSAVCAVLLVAVIILATRPSGAPPAPLTYNDRFIELQRRERAIATKNTELAMHQMGNGQHSPVQAAKVKQLEGEVQQLRNELREYAAANPDLPGSPVVAIEELGKKAQQQFDEVARQLEAADNAHNPRDQQGYPIGQPAPRQFKQVAPSIGE